jgi:hypothetical protein
MVPSLPIISCNYLVSKSLEFGERLLVLTCVINYFISLVLEIRKLTLTDKAQTVLFKDPVCTAL